MKNAKISRRSFLKAGAVASAVGMLSAAPVAVHAAEADASAAADEENGLLDVFKKPKYVFLFIGDGMGTAQIQSARFYKGTVDNNGAVTEADLSFTSFPQVGSVTTYDSTSFCPDSASTATSIATGHKTESGVINMCPWTRDVPYETIAEKLHAQKGYKVGVISTVNIDHATPAAFYAHQKTRKNYYQIGVELANCITERADFPHDNYWVKATVEFSDGSRLDIPLVKSAKPQSVAFEPKRVRSLVLKDLIQAEGTSPFPALTQIEAFGTEVK